MTASPQPGAFFTLRLLALLGTVAIGAWIDPVCAADAVPDVGAWKGQRAMVDITRQLSFGARSMGAPGHARRLP